MHVRHCLDQELPSPTELPGGAGEPVVELRQLSARYFDTKDYRLLRSGVTLSQRRDGDDA
nr:hypothetical protein GCM10017611_66490 [Rhodococcus wratislaviensis]